MRALSRDEMRAAVGEKIGVSDWLVVDQARIDAFAEATDDRQFIHIDPEAAARTPFGTTIAHGFLTLSLLPYFTAQAGIVPKSMQMAINYGADRLRFLAPVRCGQRVRAHLNLLAVTEKGTNRLLVRTGVSIEIENEHKAALVAEMLTLFVTA